MTQEDGFYTRHRGVLYELEGPGSTRAPFQKGGENCTRSYVSVGYMVSTDKRGLQGTGFVRKETGWMTNCGALATLLEGECSNQTGKAPWHRHVHLIGGLARQAAIYPPKLVKAVLRCCVA